MANAIQETDGSTSMRRVLAAYFSILSAPCFILGIIKNNMMGVYSGTVCIVAVLIILGYTTVSDWKALANIVEK